MDPETDKALERLKQLRESGDLPEVAYQAAVAALQATATLSATDHSALSSGTDNVAVAERGVNVEGDVQGPIFTGDIYLGPRPANPAEGWRIYREWLLRRAGQLPLRGVDMGASDAAERAEPTQLGAGVCVAGYPDTGQTKETSPGRSVKPTSPVAG
ncbi:MAG: hypothetical protein V9G20_12745 [Candidatus Promineifilaceae bacterium]